MIDTKCMEDLFLRSNEQDQIIEKLGGLSNILYKDVNEACHTIVQSLFKNISDQKASIVVVSNVEEKKLLEKYINKIGLDQLSLIVEIHQLIKAEGIEVIRKKLVSHTLVSGNVEMSEFKWNLIHKDILSYHQSMSQTTALGKPWKDNLFDYIALSPNDKVFILHAEIDPSEFEFNPEEFRSLREIISEALYIYQRAFELNDASVTAYGIKQGNHVLDRLQDVTHDLFSFKEVAEDMRDRYYTCLHDIEHDQWNSAISSIAKLEEELNLIEFKVNKLNIKLNEKPSTLDSLKSFILTDTTLVDKKALLFNELKKLIRVLQEKHILKSELIVHKYDEILGTIDNLRTRISTWKEKLKKTISSNVKSSNKFNFKDSRLMDLEMDLQALILRINQSEIFDGPFELNTLSFKKQIEFVSQLVYEIEVIMMRIEQNIQYYQWVSFINEQEPNAQKLIQILKKFDPQDWATIFEMWYMYEVLNRGYPFGKHLNAEQLHKCYAFLESWNMEQINALLEGNQNHHKERLKELKKNNLEFYKFLTKNESFQNQTYWKHLIENCTSFFSDTFPILIVEEDDVKNFKSDCYTELFYLNSEHKHDDVLQSFKTIHSYYPESVQNHQGIDSALKNFRLNFSSPMDEIATTDRLGYSKKLANNLTSFNLHPAVFQLKNSTIISFGSEYINNVLLEALYSFGIKNILIDNSVNETIIACLLESKKIILVTEDYLLSKDEFESCLYQFQIINQSVLAGFKHINCDSKALFDNCGEGFETIIDEIKYINGNVVDYKNQSQLEFN